MMPPTTDTLALLQVRYGKLATGPGGAIVPGFDHGCTARSAGIPQEVLRQCSPVRLGLGADPGFTWDRYRWNDQGGGIVATPCAPDEPWVVFGRLRGRPEAGDGMGGRIYTEAHYGACRSATWDRAATTALGEALRPEPPEATDPAAPSLPLIAEDWPLPPDWLDRVRTPLTVVMSGKALAVQDRSSTVREQLHLMGLLLAALPRSVAWRLPWGVGLVRVSPELAIGFGEVPHRGATLGPQGLGGVDEAVLGPGRDYVRWLEGVAADARTLRELCDRVDRTLGTSPAMPAVAAEGSWTRAVSMAATVARDRRERDRIDAWLRHPDGPTPPVEVTLERAEALEAIGAGPPGRRAAVALGTLSDDWRPAWRLASARSGEVRALAALLGVIDEAPAEMPLLLGHVRVEELPSPHSLLVAERLSSLLPRTRSAETWAALATPRPNDAAWVQRWRELVDARLAWLALGDISLEQPVAVPAGSGAVWGAVASLAAHAAPEQDALDALVAACAPADEDTLARLLHRGARHRGLCAAWLLVDAVDAPAVRARFVDRCGRPSVAVALAESLERSGDPVAPSMIDLLAGEWPAIARAGAGGARLRSRLARELGQPWAALLLDEPLRDEGPARRGAGATLTRSRALEDPTTARRLLRALVQGRDPFVGQCAASWASKIARDRLTRDHDLSLVSALVQGRVSALPSVSEAQTELVARVAPLLSPALRMRPAEILSHATCLGHVRVALALSDPTEPPDLPARATALLLEALARGPVPPWLARLRLPTDRPGWRLVAGTHRGRLDATEAEALGLLRPASLVATLCRLPGLRPDADLLDRVPDHEVGALRLDEGRVLDLLAVARSAGAGRFERRLIGAAVELLAALGVDAEAILEGAGRGVLRRAARWVSGVDDDPLTAQVVSWARRNDGPLPRLRRHR